MAFIDPAGPGRRLIAIPILLAAALAACSRRVPTLVPPPCEVEAVEGFGSAAIAGTEASVKGKFGFVFRKSGLGRVEAIDPIGRTAFLIILRHGRAWFILPERRLYAEDSAEAMMERFLGVALEPREAVLLLSGTWRAGTVAAADEAWTFVEDAQGRIAGGTRDRSSFAVEAFFAGDAVPRVIGLRGSSGTSGRVKVLELAFNPAPRGEAFDLAFLSRFTAKPWAELAELLGR